MSGLTDPEVTIRGPRSPSRAAGRLGRRIWDKAAGQSPRGGDGRVRLLPICADAGARLCARREPRIAARPTSASRFRLSPWARAASLPARRTAARGGDATTRYEPRPRPLMHQRAARELRSPASARAVRAISASGSARAPRGDAEAVRADHDPGPGLRLLVPARTRSRPRRSASRRRPWLKEYVLPEHDRSDLDKHANPTFRASRASRNFSRLTRQPPENMIYSTQLRASHGILPGGTGGDRSSARLGYI